MDLKTKTIKRRNEEALAQTPEFVMKADLAEVKPVEQIRWSVDLPSDGNDNVLFASAPGAPIYLFDRNRGLECSDVVINSILQRDLLLVGLRVRILIDPTYFTAHGITSEGREAIWQCDALKPVWHLINAFQMQMITDQRISIADVALRDVAQVIAPAPSKTVVLKDHAARFNELLKARNLPLFFPRNPTEGADSQTVFDCSIQHSHRLSRPTVLERGIPLVWKLEVMDEVQKSMMDAACSIFPASEGQPAVYRSGHFDLEFSMLGCELKKGRPEDIKLMKNPEFNHSVSPPMSIS